MSTKIVFTHWGQLHAKYGDAGLVAIRTALADLVAADQQRSLQTVVVGVDVAADMQRFNAPPVLDAGSPAEAKRAVDAAYFSLRPDYLMLLGAPDVIPHQDLANPLEGGSDPDVIVWSDLPYACDHPYSNRAEDFLGVTRVIGRIPDIRGASDPEYLLRALATACNWRSRPPAAYAEYLGISADEWNNSTAMSLQAVFGSHGALQLSPAAGPNWPPPLLERLSHFINCHGAPSDPNFYGQRGPIYPVAHASNWAAGRVREGVVVAAECCYGAELYDPAPVAGQVSLCNTYLGQGGYGFFGSSTIAYGPAAGNGAADLICQYFFQRVLAGASLGRAALESQQRFCRETAATDPIDLKTMAQYILLGDPSIQPVSAPAAHLFATDVLTKIRGGGTNATSHLRAERRRGLLAKGALIGATQPVAVRDRTVKPAGELAHQLQRVAEEAGLNKPEMLTYRVRRPEAALSKALAAFKEKLPPEIIHVVAGRTEQPIGSPRVDLLVMREVNGQIVSVRRRVSR